MLNRVVRYPQSMLLNTVSSISITTKESALFVDAVIIVNISSVEYTCTWHIYAIHIKVISARYLLTSRFLTFAIIIIIIIWVLI